MNNAEFLFLNEAARGILAILRFAAWSLRQLALMLLLGLGVNRLGLRCTAVRPL